MYNLVNTVNGHPYTHHRSQELYQPVQKASLCLFDTTASSPWKEPLPFHRKPFFVFLYSFITYVGILPHCTSVLLFIFKIRLLNVFKSSGSLSVYRWFICRVWTICVEFPYSLDFADCVVVILFCFLQIAPGSRSLMRHRVKSLVIVVSCSSIRMHILIVLLLSCYETRYLTT